MKLYNLTIQKNVNYYFIIIYTQINFRSFKNFSFLPKNFIKKYKSTVWTDFNYKFEVKPNATIVNNIFSPESLKYSTKVLVTCNNFKLTSNKTSNDFKLTYKYTRYLETTLLNFNVNRSFLSKFKNTCLTDGFHNINDKFKHNTLTILLNSINSIYIYNLFNKINYLLLFKSRNMLYYLNCKTFSKISLQKNQLNTKYILNLNFKFL